MHFISHRCNDINKVQEAFHVDGFECDVQLSKDGVPVLFHDAITKDGKKVSACLSENFVTVKAVCDVIAAHHFNKPWTIFWEIKSADALLPEQLAKVIEACQGEHVNHVIISFLPEQLKCLRAYSTSLVLGLSIRDLNTPQEKQDMSGQFGLAHTDDIKEALASFSELSLNMLTIDIGLVERCAYKVPNIDLPLVCWTVNDENQAKKIDGLCEYLISDLNSIESQDATNELRKLLRNRIESAENEGETKRSLGEIVHDTLKRLTKKQ